VIVVGAGVALDRFSGSGTIAFMPLSRKSDQPKERPTDPLKYFSKDGPWVRLGALFLCKLPRILASISLSVAAVVSYAAKAKGWW